MTAKPTYKDDVLPVLGCGLLLVVYAIYSARKPYWFDEIGTWVYVSDPSFGHMLNSVATGDTVPPLFYVLGQVWIRVLNGSIESLRLFSSLGLCAALLITWKLIRGVYGFWASALGVFALFTLPYTFLEQNAEARFYGLLMALVALLALEYQALCRAERPARWRIAAALTCAALVITHPFGFIYSGLIVLALATYDFIQRRRLRWRLYASVLAGWLVFVPWLLGPFRTQMQVIGQHNWVAVPKLNNLAEMYVLGFSPIVLAIVVALGSLVILAYLLRRRRRAGYLASLPRGFMATPDQRALLILAGWLLTTPLAAFVLSNTLTSVFVIRYMLPASVGVVIVLAQLCTLLTPLPKTDKPFRVRLGLRVLPAVLLGILCLFPVLYTQTRLAQPHPGPFDLRYGYADLPIAVLSANLYFLRSYYTPGTDRYFFLEDRQVADDPQTPALSAALDYRFMAAFKNNYPTLWNNATHIVDFAQFLDTYPRFLLIHETQRRWFEARILNNTAYVHTVLGATEAFYYDADGFDLILVEKKTAPGSP